MLFYMHRFNQISARSLSRVGGNVCRMHIRRYTVVVVSVDSVSVIVQGFTITPAVRIRNNAFFQLLILMIFRERHIFRGSERGITGRVEVIEAL